MNRTITLAGCLCAASVVSQAPAFGQAAAPEPKGWETVANAGLTLTRGNSHTMLATVGLDTKRKWESDEALLGISGAYGKNHAEVNTDVVRAYGQYNHLLSERAYFGLRVDGEHDGVADLAYRARISPLVGYYFIKNDRTTLSMDVGPALVREERNSSRNGAVITPASSSTSFALRIGEKFEHKLTDTTKVWQTAEYIPTVKDWPDKDLINAEIGISTAITPKWDLQVKLQVNYDNGVVTPKKTTDTRLIAGTAYKF